MVFYDYGAFLLYVAEVKKRVQIVYTAMYIFVLIVEGDYYGHILCHR